MGLKSRKTAQTKLGARDGARLVKGTLRWAPAVIFGSNVSFNT